MRITTAKCRKCSKILAFIGKQKEGDYGPHKNPLIRLSSKERRSKIYKLQLIRLIRSGKKWATLQSVIYHRIYDMLEEGACAVAIFGFFAQ